MPKLRFLALLLFLTLNVANAMFDYNILNIRFELVSKYDSLNWDGRNKDLITPQDLANLQDKDYNAFGIPLPKRIIFEVLNFHKNHNDEFSLLVKQYPFAQLIFSQWQTIKLYERHKELTQNPKLKYKDFMSEHFRFTYNGRNLNIYEAIAKMKLQERNNANNESYYGIDDVWTTLADNTENLTLYDFIYDIIPNSIKREFLKDESTMKSYLPLKSESFEYTQNNFKDKIELHTNIYGDKPFNEKNIKKEWHTINALNLKGYDIASKELIIPKAKHNKLGIAYNELWELMNVNQEDLEYFTFWELKHIPAPELTEYDIDEEGVKYAVGEWNKHVLDYKTKASWEDILRFMQSYAPYADSYLHLYGGEIWDRGSAFITSSEIKKLAATQYYQAQMLILHNNFSTNNAIFEEARQQMRKDPNIDFHPTTRPSCAEYCHYVAGFELDAYLAYRFNQALALVFVGAYYKGE
ncbi:hypothetical protein ACWIWK_00665 [Helicobacter sp. 23-1048]